MNNKKPLLTVEYLDKYFKKGNTIFHAVNNANFVVNEGDFFGIIGESGSGKSTIGKMLIRLLLADKGIVNFDGNFISSKKISKKVHKWLTQNMQMIFQDPMSSLNPKKNVLNLIAEPLKINRSLVTEAKKIINDHIEINKYFQYSYKEQDFLVSKEFDDFYFPNMIQAYQESNKTLKSFIYNDDNTIQENKFVLVNIIMELDEKTKKINYSLYKHAEEIKNIFYKCKEIHNLKQNHETEIKLFEIEEEIKKYKKLSSFPQIYWDKLKQKKELIQKLKIHLQTSYEKYNDQIPEFIKAVKSSIKNEIANIKNKISLTKDFTVAIGLHLEIFTRKLFICIVDALKNEFIVDINDAKNIVDLISSWTKKQLKNLWYTYDKLLEFKKEKDKIAKEYFNDNFISKAEYEHLLNSEFSLINLFKKPANIKNIYLLNKDIIKIMSKFRGLEIKEKLDLINETYLKLWSLISQNEPIDYLETIDYKNIFDIKTYESNKFRILDKRKTNEIQKEIYDLEVEIKDIKLKIANKDYSLELLENYYHLEKLLNKKVQVNEECQKHYQEDINIFNQNVLPKIEEHKEILKKYKQDLEIAKKENKKIIKNILNSIIKNQKLKSKNNKLDKEKIKLDLESLKLDVNSKVKTIEALKFEFNTILEEVNLYRSLRNKNPILVKLHQNILVKTLMKIKVYSALSSVGLKNEHAYRYPHEFSGGQRQRIVIARALINNPKIIIADEPISALDVSIQAQVINIMKKLSSEKGITFIFIAHDLSMVNYACNRMIIMHNGRILEKGNTKEIFQNPIHPYTLSLLKAAPQLSKIHVNLAQGSSDLNYQPSPNDETKVSFYSIKGDKEHFVFGSEEQIKKWTRKIQ